MADMIFKGEVFSTDVKKRICYAWAYVTEEVNKQVVDHSGDVWDITEVEKTAHDFIACRVGGEAHVYKGGAILVESMVFTKELQKALGIDLQKVGWLVAFEVTDDDLLEKIEDGTYKMMSIGGTGTKEEIDA